MSEHPNTQPPQQEPMQWPPYQQPKKQHLFGKIVLGVLLALILFVGGCIVFTGAVLNEAADEVEKEQAETAITVKQFKSVEDGDSLKSVIAELGKPDSRDSTDAEGKAFDGTCIYYNVEGGELLDRFQLCFNAKDELRSKSRY